MSEELCVSLESYSSIPSGSEQYSYDFIEANGAIILSKTDTDLLIGLTKTSNEDLKRILESFHHTIPSYVAINPVELSSYLGKKLGEDAQSQVQSQTLDNSVSLDKIANDAPIINLVNSICIDGIRAGASDIHLECTVHDFVVRYRLDGLLQTVKWLEKERFPAVSSRIKIMANLNILERRLPQDGRISVNVGKETVDLRVSIVPVSGGESIVLRLLGKNSFQYSLDELGFSPSQLTIIRNLLKIPHGLIIVSGPTGSGKTTTLNAMIRELVSDTVKIITIEDPVEFIIQGVNQIQVNEEINLGFDTILRRVLRQDPNIIMVGEIRDSATAELAVRAALTGHLVLSTVHTNDSAAVINRLKNMGIEPYLIASVLKGAIAQRLVRKCTIPDKSSEPIYKGRTVVGEVFETDQELEELISTQKSQKNIIDYLSHKGMSFMFDEAKRKVSEGITTIKEVQREILCSEGDF